MSTKGQETRERMVATAEALILAKGFAGMSLDELLSQAGLTKGAFFHHFKGKSDLAKAVVERYWENDLALFQGFSDQADRLSDDALERVYIFLRLFEDYLDGLGAPAPGCIFASYTYERHQFGTDVQDYIRKSFDVLGVVVRGQTCSIDRGAPANRRRHRPAIGGVDCFDHRGWFHNGQRLRRRDLVAAPNRRISSLPAFAV